MSRTHPGQNSVPTPTPARHRIRLKKVFSDPRSGHATRTACRRARSKLCYLTAVGVVASSGYFEHHFHVASSRCACRGTRALSILHLLAAAKGSTQAFPPATPHSAQAIRPRRRPKRQLRTIRAWCLRRGPPVQPLGKQDRQARPPKSVMSFSVSRPKFNAALWSFINSLDLWQNKTALISDGRQLS